MGLVLVTAALKEPVSWLELREHSRIDNDDEAALLADLVRGAREIAESVTRRQFIDASWRLSLDYFPSGSNPIIVPKPPLDSVTSITYTDTGGTSQTWTSTLYTVDTDSDPGRIVPAYQQWYPDTRAVPNAVKVTFKAGYGAEPTDVPQGIREFIKALAAHWYENREEGRTVPDPLYQLLWPFRELSFG